MFDDEKSGDEAIIADYIQTQAIRGNKELAWELKMFFSPNCVPAGLTDEMVTTCIFIHKIKKDAQSRMTREASIARDEGDEKAFLYFTTPIMVPLEIRGIRSVTERNFQIGIGRLLMTLSRINLLLRD